MEQGNIIAGKGAGRLQGYSGYLENVNEDNYSGANFRKSGYAPGHSFENKTIGWQPTCTCGREDTVPCVVLDPFLGSGTVAVIARELNRSSVGCELNPEYIKIIRKRLRADSQLDTGVVEYKFEKVKER